MKINMIPGISMARNEPGGISRVIEAYCKYLPDLGIEIVEGDDCDLKVVHAGITGSDCDVAILHGIYFTGDYQASNFENRANANIVQAVRSAQAITVPSRWVAEIIQRDMHQTPFVVPHGIDAWEWEHDFEPEGYALWNKNRDGMDVCNSIHLIRLAEKAREFKFVSTFAKVSLPNINIIGLKKHSEMKPIIQKASVYLSLTKETFGIGTLEAMASGVPVLGWKSGGNIDLIHHCVNGYLAEPYDYDDLLDGLKYCLEYHNTLGDNGRELAKDWTWESAVHQLERALTYAYTKRSKIKQSESVSVIIPSYNYAHKVVGAIESVLAQSLPPHEIIVVDDGSTDNTQAVVSAYTDFGVQYLHQKNEGVAVARNNGVFHSTGDYICCLDADDRITPDYLKICVDALRDNPALGIAYTRLMGVNKDGQRSVSNWPDKFEYDRMLRRQNQIPTCNVARRSVWDRLAGQRQRYAPLGAGAEDAEMWLRAGALGIQAALVSELPLFLYSMGTGNTSKPGYHETDWLSWHPWTYDHIHPFASLARPERASHKVYQYDEPVVSVIVPVGQGHEMTVTNVLDSLEAQTFRKWEVVLVYDSVDDPPEIITNGFPYARIYRTPVPRSGPGVARNLGVKMARGNLILFMDADDWLYPGRSLERMVDVWTRTNSIVYSDYYGKATVSKEFLEQNQSRVVDRNPRTGETILIHHALDYDCELAQQQPESRVYHWCLVSCLIPKVWHNAIGGFDEEMRSWEDVDYHWRMARAGYCYTRISDPLIVYNFDSGTRRLAASADTNIEIGRELLKYMQEKYKGVEKMPCPFGCGGSAPTRGQDLTQRMDAFTSQFNSDGGRMNESDSSVVEVELRDLNMGEHMIIGAATGQRYGYRSHGERFLVMVQDQQAMAHILIPIATINAGTAAPVVKAPVVTPQPIRPVVKDIPAPAPVTIKEEPKEVEKPLAEVKPPELNADLDAHIDVQAVPGVSEVIAKQLIEKGIDTKRKILDLGKEGLMQFNGVGERRAEIILKAIEGK